MGLLLRVMFNILSQITLNLKVKFIGNEEQHCLLPSLVDDFTCPHVHSENALLTHILSTLFSALHSVIHYFHTKHSMNWLWSQSLVPTTELKVTISNCKTKSKSKSFTRQNLHQCPLACCNTAYLTLIWPLQAYGVAMWDPVDLKKDMDLRSAPSAMQHTSSLATTGLWSQAVSPDSSRKPSYSLCKTKSNTNYSTRLSS